MSKNLKTSTVWFLGLACGLLVGLGMMAGTVVTMSCLSSSRTIQQPAFPIPSNVLHAASSDSGKSMAIATAQVYEDAEGLFVLDFLTGDLQCWVINRLNPQMHIGLFKSNVTEALGIEKGKAADYILATARYSPVGGAAGPADCICYVADCNSGKVATYSLLFDRTNARRGRTPQLGELRLLGVTPARPQVDAADQ